MSRSLDPDQVLDVSLSTRSRLVCTRPEVLDLRGASVKLFYDGRFGDTIQENAVGAKATVPF